jgi:hypothetical protein
MMSMVDNFVVEYDNEEFQKLLELILNEINDCINWLTYSKTEYISTNIHLSQWKRFGCPLKNRTYSIQIKALTGKLTNLKY